MKQIALILVLGLVVGQSLAVDARLRGTNKRRAAEQWTCDTPGSNPQQLPGIESMGTGYNIVTGSMTSGALFGTRAYTQHALFQPGATAPCYRIPDMFVQPSDGVGQGVLGVNFFDQIADSGFSDVYGSSVHEFQTELTNSNDLKSSFDLAGFGAKLSAAYSNSDEIKNVVSQMTNSTTRTLMMTENVQAYTATQQSFRFVKDVTNWWRQLTNAPFSANDGDDASSITWEQYFANFGTHVVTEAKIGGSIEITISWDSEDSAFNRMDAEKQKQCIKASASYMFGDDNVGGSVDDCWGHESSENHAAKILSENTQTNIVCRGGADKCPNNARSASSLALTAWRNAVLARPTYGVPARMKWTEQVIRGVRVAAGAEGHTELGFDSAADLDAFLEALHTNTYTYLSRNGLCALHPGACGYANRAVEALVAPAATADDATVDVHAFLTKGYPALVNAAVTRDGVARSQQAVLAALKTAAAGGTYLTHNSKQCENSAGAFNTPPPADGFCNGQADCISKAKEHCDNIPLCIGFMYAPAWSSTNVQWCKGHTLTGSNDWTAYTSTGVSSGAIANSTAAFKALAKAMLTASATAVNALAASDVAGGIFENVTALVAKIGTMEEGDGTAAPSPERVLAADLAAILDNAADELEGIKKELAGARLPLKQAITDEMKKHASTSLNMRVTDQKTVVTNAQNACNRNVKTARERAYPSCAALVFIPPAAAACYAAAIPIVENKHADCNHGVAAMRAELLVRQDALASFNKEAQKFVAQAGNIASAAHAFETQLSSPDRATGRVAGVVPALRQLASDLSNEDSPLAWWKNDILAKLKGVAATYSESFVNEASWLLKCCDGDDCEVAASTRARRMAITGPACHAAGGTLV